MSCGLRGFGVAILVLGCGGGQPEAIERVDSRFASPEAERAEQSVPDMFEAARRARSAAISARAEGDLAKSEDHAICARLLLSAAIAEADRIEVQERRLVVEARERGAQQQAGRAIAQRRELERQTARMQAARVARAEADRVFEIAVDDETRRRGGSEQREQTHRMATDFLLRRARLVVAAARALGAPADDAERLVTEIAAVERDRGPAARRLSQADALYLEGLALLGQARAQRDGPTADEIVSLRSAAVEGQFELEQRDEALVLTLDDAFSGRAVGPGRVAARRLTRLGALLAAHPHGPVLVRVYAADARQERLAQDRTRGVCERLREAAGDESRFAACSELQSPVSVETVGRVEVLLPAYRAVAGGAADQ